MISKETNNRETMLIELSIIATSHGILSHFKTKMNSAKAIAQPMPNITLNLVCDKGDEAMRIMNRRTRNVERRRKNSTHHSTFLVPCSIFSAFLVRYSSN